MDALERMDTVTRQKLLRLQSQLKSIQRTIVFAATNEDAAKELRIRALALTMDTLEMLLK